MRHVPGRQRDPLHAAVRHPVRGRRLPLAALLAAHRPDWLPSWFSPGLLILWIPLGFRATCYYYRKAYYRFYFADPPGCAVGEPTVHRRYGMETAFPFILQNLHRYFLYLAFIPLSFLWHGRLPRVCHEGQWRLGLGSVLFLVNVILLTGYSLSCHSLRHLVGGKLDCFSCTRRAAGPLLALAAAHSLNRHHMAWAWASLISVTAADVYVRLLALGIIRDPATIIRPVIDRSERYPHDVLVVGAGGAGLRAAIEAAASGASVGLVCKSLLGKAHTVMAEGGVAAALAHVDDKDSWQVHFRDTMVGGKLLNNPRMAQLHAQEAPDRVRELEAWGAVFDRTRDGRILQRPFGGHSHPRLAHVGDRTGLEMIRTLQDRAVAGGITVYMECTITRLLSRPDRVKGAFGYWRTTGDPVVFPAKAVVLATGGIGRAYQVTSNSWEYSGDGQALAYLAGAELIDMEFVQFHPTGMVWPPGVRGLLVTEAVRGEGGILRNKDGERFMWKYLPEDRRHEYAATDEEAATWVEALRAGRPTDARRPPELSTRDNVSRAIYTEVREGRGSPHGGVFLDISYLPAEHVRRKLPSMYDQFKELADVDITAGPMEVGPTTHYVMGGIRVDAETGATTGPGLFAAGEVAGGMHGANRLGGNSLSDLLVFGQRTGAGAAAYAAAQDDVAWVDPAAVQAAATELAAPLEEGSRRGSVPAPPGPPGDHAVARRHLPDRRGPRRGDRPARRAPRPLARGPDLRRSRLQPGLGPGLRAAQHAHRVGGDRSERQAASREPRRAQPPRLPGARRSSGDNEQRRPARRRRHGGRNDAVAGPAG